MRVPVSTPTTARGGNMAIPSLFNTPNLCFEPTSVLDLQRSPSPNPQYTLENSGISDPLTNQEYALEIDEHVLHNLDWDSIMRDMGNLHDDSVNTRDTLATQLSESMPADSFNLHVSDIYSSPILAHNCNEIENSGLQMKHANNWNPTALDFIEELLRAADCFHANESQLAQVILERLHHRLGSPDGKPLLRAAFYFKEALQSLLTNSKRTQRFSSRSEIVQKIRAYNVFSVISPILNFSHLTSNQALLEALHDSPFIHVIDFNVGFGCQYASLMKEIVENAKSSQIKSPAFRITAVMPEEYAIETRLIEENLNQFAQEQRIRFQVEFVSMHTFETLWFKSVKFTDGEKTAVVLSPSIFRCLGSTDDIVKFLSDVRGVSPSIVVFADSEGWAEMVGATSFSQDFVNDLEFYSAMLESLDESIVGGGGEWIKTIEMLLLQPKMLAAVEGAGRRVAAWKEVFYGAGMRPVHLSRFADFQAECLLWKVDVRGFHVGKRQAELVLCWRNRAMVAMSAWQT